MKFKIKKKLRNNLGVVPLNLNSKKKISFNSKLNKNRYSTHKLSLNEKSKFKLNFLITEKQFRSFINSVRVGKYRNFKNLYNRLDLIVFTGLGSAHSLRSIRQDILHGRVLVNNARERRPKFLCNPNDVIIYKNSRYLKANQNKNYFSINLKLLTEYFQKF